MDSINKCLDKKHFLSYPYNIDYRYNSRGFRDNEWPDQVDALRNAIWCVGDSCTIGIGSPLEHTWVNLLSRNLSQRTINISMEGASNDWISRRAAQIQEYIKPSCMIIMWSYVSRREINNNQLDDEKRRLPRDPIQQNLLADADNFKGNLDRLLKFDSKIINFLVPGTFPTSCIDESRKIWNDIKEKDWPDSCPDDLENLSKHIKDKITQTYAVWEYLKFNKKIQYLLLSYDVTEVKQLDLARDGHHFDIKTSQWIVNQIISKFRDPYLKQGK